MASMPATSIDADLDLALAEDLARTVEADRLVRLLMDRGLLTQTTIADATGAAVRSVRNWASGAQLRQQFDDRLRVLAEVIGMLSTTVTPRGFGQWLNARNRMLDGGRPVEAISADEFDAVRRAARKISGGAHA